MFNIFSLSFLITVSIVNEINGVPQVDKKYAMLMAKHSMFAYAIKHLGDFKGLSRDQRKVMHELWAYFSYRSDQAYFCGIQHPIQRDDCRIVGINNLWKTEILKRKRIIKSYHSVVSSLLMNVDMEYSDILRHIEAYLLTRRKLLKHALIAEEDKRREMWFFQRWRHDFKGYKKTRAYKSRMFDEPVW